MWTWRNVLEPSALSMHHLKESEMQLGLYVQNISICGPDNSKALAQKMDNKKRNSIKQVTKTVICKEQ